MYWRCPDTFDFIEKVTLPIRRWIGPQTSWAAFLRGHAEAILAHRPP
jgi:hypothetical protein